MFKFGMHQLVKFNDKTGYVVARVVDCPFPYYVQMDKENDLCLKYSSVANISGNICICTEEELTVTL